MLRLSSAGVVDGDRLYTSQNNVLGWKQGEKGVASSVVLVN